MELLVPEHQSPNSQTEYKGRLLVGACLVLALAACGRKAPAPVVYPSDPPRAAAKSAPESRGPVAPRRPAETPPSGLYVVVPGDNVYGLARRFGVPIRDLIAENRLSPPYRLTVGQRLRFPRARYHEVVAGDTIHGISRSYGVAARSLVTLNRIPPPYTITVGQRLKLPASVPVASVPDRTTATRAAPGRPPVPGKKPRPSTASRPFAVPKPPPRSVGRFAWPLRGPVLSRFGPKPGGQHNDGINIAAAQGAPVRAAENGVVAYVGNELRGFGKLLLLRHAEGWMTAYAHNNALLVRLGETVKRGQLIARAGSSGNVDRPQLHFEIRRGTSAVDPHRYLSRRGAARRTGSPRRAATPGDRPGPG